MITKKQTSLNDSDSNLTLSLLIKFNNTYDSKLDDINSSASQNLTKNYKNWVKLKNKINLIKIIIVIQTYR
jgi:hypothetical protein